MANSNDDSVSVINEDTDTVAQTAATNPVPGATVGSYANSISMVDPHTVLVSDRARQRDRGLPLQRTGAAAAIRGSAPDRLVPGAVAPDPALGQGAVVVTNDKGIGALGPESTINKGPYTVRATGHNTYDDTGSVTVVHRCRAQVGLAQDTQTVFTDNDWNQIKPINKGDYDTVPTVIPRHLGEPRRSSTWS